MMHKCNTFPQKRAPLSHPFTHRGLGKTLTSRLSHRLILGNTAAVWLMCFFRKVTQVYLLQTQQTIIISRVTNAVLCPRVFVSLKIRKTYNYSCVVLPSEPRLIVFYSLKFFSNGFLYFVQRLTPFRQRGPHEI